jgi:glycerophosphoryl diester phosphodiesterase
MVQIIGHRGAPALVPENTIESFKSAIESCADYIECDVHLSRDGEIIVMHDEQVDRTTNGKGVVRDFTLEELKTLTIPGGLRIPTIEEVLELDFPVMIELKSYHDGKYRPYDSLVMKLLQLLRETKPQQEIIFESYEGPYPEQLRGSGFKRLLLMPEIPDLRVLSSLDLFAIGVYYRDLTAGLVEEAHSRHLKVFSWPPDRREDIERAIELGLDLLLSNDPGHAIGVARKLGHHR